MDWFIKAFSGGGALIFATGAVFWVWNLWRTFAAEARRRNRAQADDRQLPTVEG